MSDTRDSGRPLRRLLIALNATEGDRGAVCRLARAEAWLLRPGRGHPEGVQVDKEALDRGRERLARADEIADRELELARAAGADIVTRLDALYPEALRDLDLPPPVLYSRGELPSAPAIAIVGSRLADTYGLETAESFARHLATTGLVIVSGLARGIDSAAHRGALAAEGGRTVAVLGCGVDVDYPRGSARLAERISGAGAVVSEFPIGTRPHRPNFPTRNRLIAALGLGTFVVRATARSGSLITARLALELGRDVYALPGNIYDRRSIGPNTLIRDGALPVQHPREILESLSIAVRERLTDGVDEPNDASPGEPEAHLKKVYARLSLGEPHTVEELSASTGLAVPGVLSALLELELGGWVRRYPGPTFCRRA